MIPDAHNSSGSDLFKKHSRFSISNIKNFVAKQRRTCEHYAETNYTWSGTLLLSTLHPELYAKVIQAVGVSPSGSEVFIATMKEVHNGTHHEQMEQLKGSFKLLKLSDFTGENIQEANEKIKDIMDHCPLVTTSYSIRLVSMNSPPRNTCVFGQIMNTTVWQPLYPDAVSWIPPLSPPFQHHCDQIIRIDLSRSIVIGTLDRGSSSAFILT